MVLTISFLFLHRKKNDFLLDKNNNYILDKNGNRIIKKSVIPIIRMAVINKISNTYELKGTLKLSNMIPVPKDELIPYLLNNESDYNYKSLVQKEYDFIKKNYSLILKYASILYNQKINEETYFSDFNRPKYLLNTVDFKYAESLCEIYCNMNMIINDVFLENEFTDDTLKPDESFQMDL